MRFCRPVPRGVAAVTGRCEASRAISVVASASSTVDKANTAPALIVASSAPPKIGPMMRDPGAGMPATRHPVETAGLRELRFGRSHRIAYVIESSRVLLLHAWGKRSQRTERRDIATAERRRSQ